MLTKTIGSLEMELEIQKLREVRIPIIIGIPDSNRRIMVRCPFHRDNTPSFAIFPDNSFHCFGCNAHGFNAIDFVMKLGATFKEAKEELKKYV